jgi:hypothetical protein
VQVAQLKGVVAGAAAHDFHGLPARHDPVSHHTIQGANIEHFFI